MEGSVRERTLTFFEPCAEAYSVHTSGSEATERRWNRTVQLEGCSGWPVLKCGLWRCSLQGYRVGVVLLNEVRSAELGTWFGTRPQRNHAPQRLLLASPTRSP